MSLPAELVEQIREIVAKVGGRFEGIQEAIGDRFPEVVYYDARCGCGPMATAFNPENFNSDLLTDMVDRNLGTFSQEKKKVSKKEASNETSATTLRAKLNGLYSAIGFVEKAGHNSGQNYDYVRAADVLHTIRKALIDARVYAEVNYEFIGTPYTIARAKDPNAPFTAVNVKASVVFHDLDTSETISASGLGTGADTGDKAAYKAQTGALKYALRAAALIPDEADSDPEADERVDEQPEPQRQAPRQAPAPRQEAPAPPAPAPSPRTPESPAIAPTAAATPAEAPQTEAGVDAALDAAPTEGQLVGYRAEFKKLGDDLSAEGGLKASKGLKLNTKLVVFLLATEKVANTGLLTVGQWEDFFGRIDAARTNPAVGLKGITVLVNKANGIEAK